MNADQHTIDVTGKDPLLRALERMEQWRIRLAPRTIYVPDEMVDKAQGLFPDAEVLPLSRIHP